MEGMNVINKLVNDQIITFFSSFTTNNSIKTENNSNINKNKNTVNLFFRDQMRQSKKLD